MTIDERLEALTHTVELLASFHKDNELRMGQLTETMTRLGNIIIAHEQRIEDLEDRQQ